MKKIVLLSGKAGAGKTTIQELTAARIPKCLTCNFADLLKYSAKVFLGWDGKKDKEGRRLLQHFGTDVVKAYRPNFWSAYLTDMITMTKDMYDYCIIADWRFPDEYNVLRAGITNNIEIIRVRIERDNVYIMPGENATHSSETIMDSYKEFDHIIRNEEGKDGAVKCSDELLRIMEVAV